MKKFLIIIAVIAPHFLSGQSIRNLNHLRIPIQLLQEIQLQEIWVLRYKVTGLVLAV